MEIEVGLDSAIVMQKLSNRIIMDGGIFLCIDYGQNNPIVDTFRVCINIVWHICTNIYFILGF